MTFANETTFGPFPGNNSVLFVVACASIAKAVPVKATYAHLLAEIITAFSIVPKTENKDSKAYEVAEGEILVIQSVGVGVSLYSTRESSNPL